MSNQHIEIVHWLSYCNCAFSVVLLFYYYVSLPCSALGWSVVCDCNSILFILICDFVEIHCNVFVVFVHCYNFTNYGHSSD